MNSLDPKITLAVYIGGATILVLVLLYMFLYSSRLKAKKAAQEKLGRPEVTREEGIAIATDNKEKSGRSGTL